MKEKNPANPRKRKEFGLQTESVQPAELSEKKPSSSPSQIQILCSRLEESFPLEEKTFIDLFPFPNEGNYYEVLAQLKHLPRVNSNTQKAVLLFGNSNLLSLLPEIADKSTLLILADIDWRTHIHNLHLLNCLLDASDPETFIQCYHKNNPLIGIPCQGKKRGLLDNCPEVFHAEWLGNTLIETSAYLGEYGFLNGIERYNQCKAAARKIATVNIQLDLTNKNLCYKLANILNKYQMDFLLCNFSNIHQYDQQQDLCDSVSLLLHHSEDFFIMYSRPTEAGKPDLNTKLTRGLSDYFTECLPITYECFRQRLACSSQKRTLGSVADNPYSVFTHSKEEEASDKKRPCPFFGE